MHFPPHFDQITTLSGIKEIHSAAALSDTSRWLEVDTDEHTAAVFEEEAFGGWDAFRLFGVAVCYVTGGGGVASDGAFSGMAGATPSADAPGAVPIMSDVVAGNIRDAMSPRPPGPTPREPTYAKFRWRALPGTRPFKPAPAPAPKPFVPKEPEETLEAKRWRGHYPRHAEYTDEEAEWESRLVELLGRIPPVDFPTTELAKARRSLLIPL